MRWELSGLKLINHSRPKLKLTQYLHLLRLEHKEVWETDITLLKRQVDPNTLNWGNENIMLKVKH